MLLGACAGRVPIPHPVLLAARELARLHAAHIENAGALSCARSQHIRDIDRWVADEIPAPVSAAYLHTETVGMVVDRIARLSAVVHAGERGGHHEAELPRMWQALSELAIGYGDLAFEVGQRTRRLPSFPGRIRGDVRDA
ncbi:MAG: DUF4254 domain-containing protein [Nocardia sp.]|nr:DUF4254 domain-containing protein [Nocardia sp.]